MRPSCTSFPRLAAAVLASACAGSLVAQESASPPIRVGLRARNGGADRLTSLRYVGGFETKTLVYETLVRRGEDGRIEPGLASGFSAEDGGRTFRFELREGATFHDGKPVTAAAVKEHFQRWAGLPEHNWLPVNRFLAGVQVESERVLRVELTQPYALLSDLVAINPCAIVGPGARDWEGEFVRPMGTGPFRFVDSIDGGRRWRLASTTRDQELEVSFYPRGRDATPIDDLVEGKLDLFVGGWDEDLPAARLDQLGKDPRFSVQEAPGSSVVYLSFKLSEGPTAELAVRQRIAAAIDRDALITAVEGGRADPCTTWAAPALASWPRGPGISRPAVEPASPVELALKIAAGRGRARAARAAAAVAEQLRAAGIAVDVLGAPEDAREAPVRPADAGGAVQPTTTESGEVRARANREVRRRTEAADLRIEITHGSPYDPHQSLIARFGTLPADNLDEPRPRQGVDEELMLLVVEAMVTPTEELCQPIYARIQERMDREALIVPLYVPHRVALRRAEVDGVRLGTDVYRVDLSGVHWTAAPSPQARTGR